MSQDNISISPETDPVVLKEFRVGSTSTINRICSAIYSEENEIYVYLRQKENYFVTEILDIDFEQNLIYLATPYDKKQIADISLATPYCLISFPEGVKIQFDGMGLEQVEHQRAQALRVEIPKTLIRLQRRNYFRVLADDVFRAQVKLEVPKLLEPFSVVDFSLTGCGLNVTGKAADFKVGQGFENVRLNLPDSDETLLLNIHVKNIQTSTETPEIVFLGCEISHIQRHSERRLQRFLLITERRQRATQNSID